MRRVRLRVRCVGELKSAMSKEGKRGVASVSSIKYRV